MRIESLIWLLGQIKGGKNTAYILQKEKSTVVTKYIKYALQHKLITQYQDGKRRPYRLTKTGELALKALS